MTANPITVPVRHDLNFENLADLWSQASTLLSRDVEVGRPFCLARNFAMKQGQSNFQHASHAIVMTDTGPLMRVLGSQNAELSRTLAPLAFDFMKNMSLLGQVNRRVSEPLRAANDGSFDTSHNFTLGLTHLGIFILCTSSLIGLRSSEASAACMIFGHPQASAHVRLQEAPHFQRCVDARMNTLALPSAGLSRGQIHVVPT